MLKIIIDSRNGIGKMESTGTLEELLQDYMVIDSVKLQIYDEISNKAKKVLAIYENVKEEEIDDEALEKTINAYFEGFEVATTKVGDIHDK